MSLNDFWQQYVPPDEELLADFLRLLKNEALLPGNFYSREGITDAVKASLQRMKIVPNTGE